MNRRAIVRAQRAAAGLVVAAGLAAAADSTLEFKLNWKDEAGNEHGFEGITVDYYDANPAGDRDAYHGGQKAFANGVANWTTARDETDDVLEPWFRVNSRINGAFNIGTVTNGGALNEAFDGTWTTSFPGAGAYTMPEGGAGSWTGAAFTGASDYRKAMIAAQTANVVHDYFKDTIGFDAPEIESGVDSTGSGAFYRKASGGDPGRIVLRGDSWRSYDVIVHEYGHHLAQTNSMSESPGGAHGWWQDQTRQRMSYDAGAKLAYSEGMVTALGIMAMAETNAAGALGLPAVATDTWYNDDGWNATGTTRTSNGLSYDLELHKTRRGVGAEANDSFRLGEANEEAISRVVWDLYDSNKDALLTGSDEISYGAKKLWDRVMKPNGGAATMAELWTNLGDDLGIAAGRTAAGLAAATTRNQAMTHAGAVIEDQGVSASALWATGLDSTTININSDVGRLVGRERNSDNSLWFRVALFETDWDFAAWTDPQRDTTHVDPTTGAAGDTSDPLRFDISGLGLDEGDYYWVVLSNPGGIIDMLAEHLVDDFDASSGMWYWSGAEEIAVVPSPAAPIVLSCFGLATLRRRR